VGGGRAGAGRSSMAVDVICPGCRPAYALPAREPCACPLLAVAGSVAEILDSFFPVRRDWEAPRLEVHRHKCPPVLCRERSEPTFYTADFPDESRGSFYSSLSTSNSFTCLPSYSRVALRVCDVRFGLVFRWRRIAAAIEEAAPLHEGREVAVLRRMESLGKLRKTIEVLLSPASLEPGIVGIARPILLWPEGISEHLEDMHLEAIVAHEVWHVKRWDNLAAAVHLTVEALFWFHPLVWWLGGRLLDERERACDEAVLEIGSERLIYAESILRTCEFCVQSRLACASGVAGGDLKKRIAHIMAQPVACSLDLRKKLLLGAAGLAAIAMPLMLGLLNITPVRAGPLAKNPAGGERMSEVPYAIHDLPAATPFVSKVRSSKAKVCLKSARVHKPDLSVKTDAGREH